ncbi:MAG TPA: HEAT repeat domain-containing protein [Bryobacteraceae bacterium]|nr:HEAT repeat domain-containing protein [Bryobacteraceae bacterium]
MDTQQFLRDLQSDNPDTRFAAWRQAGTAPAAVIPQLGKIAASQDPGVAKAGREALATIVHSVGKDPMTANRAAAVKGLLDLTGSDNTPAVRVHAMRLLSNIAGEESVPAIGKQLSNPELREEAAFTLERIGGGAVVKAFMAAYRDSKDDFRPRILAALGHLRAAEATELVTEAMRSPNKDVALAAARAFGRTGRKPAGQIPAVALTGTWDQIEYADSQLRYADGRAKDGDTAEAMRVYRTMLDRPEEHLQCAAIIGIAKLNTAEAASAIMPKLKSSNSKVRITAATAWKGMAAARSGT